MTLTLDRPVDVTTDQRERMAHIVRDPAEPFPRPALCGFICTRWAPADWPHCQECAAIARDR